MKRNSAVDWNQRYQSNTVLPTACFSLQKYAYLLPKTGKALDLACGLGGNALFLAQLGLECSAWDFSAQGITQLQQLAQDLALSLNTEVRDVVLNPPAVNSFDVIVVSHFLDRDLAVPLKNALTKGGILIYQTFSHEAVDLDSPPRNPAYRLAAGELLRLFSGLKVIIYHEEGNLGDSSQGFRNQALLIAQA
ncbi:MAG: methyltransferase domain-containing protein [Thiotrichaceae bacterium]|nr:methyltransferase domain-containing protein [Thiotrichaceae bacterium]